MSGQRLEQKQDQSLNLSPAQLQAIQMLELTGIELESRIERELEENPALEENEPDQISDDQGQEDSGDDWDLGDYATEDDIPSYKLEQVQDRREPRVEIPFAANAPSLDELLMEQLRLSSLTEQQLQIARYIVGNITDSGYLTRSVYELQDDLLFKASLDIPISEIEFLVQRIKELEPAGIGARDMRECLLLQLYRLSPSIEVSRSIEVLEKHYEDFVGKRFDKLCQILSITEQELQEVYQLIARLNPRPGGSLGEDTETKLLQYVPDFVVSEVDGDLVVQLINEQDLPPLRVSPSFVQMLEQVRKQKSKREDAIVFIRQKLNQAKSFIDAIEQRQRTLKQTMIAIVAHQKAFFLSGEVSDLRPMILRDIAEVTHLDISTISRVSNSKSVQTDFGIFPLKYFFGEGIKRTEDGEEVSTRHIKQLLVSLIDSEDKNAPLSDQRLMELLGEQGYPIARRTVAKYREQLRLPVARLRREIK